MKNKTEGHAVALAKAENQIIKTISKINAKMLFITMELKNDD
jgi:hypothetical protein